MKMVIIGLAAGILAAVVFLFTGSLAACLVAFALLLGIFLYIFREGKLLGDAMEARLHPGALAERYDQSLRRICDCAKKLPDEELARALNSLTATLKALGQTLSEHPEKASRARMFAKQLMPTLGDSLQNYVTLEEKGIAAPQQRQTILSFIGDMEKAAKKQMEGLYRTEAMSLEIDAKVSRSLLQAEGLLEDEHLSKSKGGSHS